MMGSLEKRKKGIDLRLKLILTLKSISMAVTNEYTSQGRQKESETIETSLKVLKVKTQRDATNQEGKLY